MTYDEKKSLYESIMKKTAKTVKRMINEAVIDDLKSGKVTKADVLSKDIARTLAEVLDGSKDRNDLNVPILIDRIKKGLEMISQENKEKQFFYDLISAFNK